MGKQSRAKGDRDVVQSHRGLFAQYGFPARPAPFGREDLDSLYARVLHGVLKVVEQEERAHAAAAAATHIVAEYDKAVDALPNAYFQRGVGHVRIECEKGCHYCCHLRVSTDGATILALAEHIRLTRNPKEGAALIAKLDAFDEESKKIDPANIAFTPRLCPLNEDGLCTVYEARPLSCRAWHSQSLAACKHGFEANHRHSRIPLDGRRMDLKHVYDAALTDGLAAAGFDMKELELAPALAIALRDAVTAEQYAKSGGVFEDAHRPEISGL